MLNNSKIHNFTFAKNRFRMSLLAKTETYVESLFKAKLFSKYLYHNFNHTVFTVESAKKILENSDVSENEKEKILVAVGNVTGIGQVSDGVKVTHSGAESRFYTVKSGDTLSAISKAMYGSANDYQRIFEANKPMLTPPDKIYPVQVLIIPAK